MAEVIKRGDLEAIQKAIAVLFASTKVGAGECVEIRTFNKQRQLVACGWYDDLGKMAVHIYKMAQMGFPPVQEGQKEPPNYIHDNIYWTLNPITDALLSRTTKNKMHWSKGTASDDTVTRRVWLLIDVDPKRPAEISATKAERKLALDVANDVLETLEGLGFPESCYVAGMSGNGFHILVRIDLPNDNASRDLVKQCLAALQELCGTSEAGVDQTVFNAARIGKCYGTKACKGADTTDRPWRWASLNIVPDKVTVVGVELLQKLAALAPTIRGKQKAASDKGPWTEELLQQYLDYTGWPCSAPQAKAGGTHWVGPCIADDSHKDAAVILHPDGWWSYSCFHNHSHERQNARLFREHFAAAVELTCPGYKYPTMSKSKFESTAWELQDADAEVPGGNDSFDSSYVFPFAVNKSPKAFRLSEMGNSERFVHRYGMWFRFKAESKLWLMWEGRYWQSDIKQKMLRCIKETHRTILDDVLEHVVDRNDKDEVEEVSKELADWEKKCESRQKQMATAALSEEPLSVSAKEFDTNPMLFNTQNGTIDLRTGVLSPHNPMDLISKISPVVCDAGATCPRWEQFVHEIFDGNKELISYIQRLCGYLLTGVAEEQIMIMLWGDGLNGKSTLVNVISHIMGDYGSEVAVDSIIERKFESTIPNDIAALAGLRFVSTSENRPNARLDSAKIKKLTSGENISARFLHCEWFTFRPAFTLWMSTNHKPTISDDSEGIWRRVKLVPFLQSFKGKEDISLESKLVAESSGILNWFLAGLRDYQAGGIREPMVVTNAISEYRTGEDSLTRFLQEETQTALRDTDCVQASALYARYKSWVERKKEFLLSERKFNEGMDSHSVVSKKRDNKKIYQVRLNPYPSWYGDRDDPDPVMPDDDDDGGLQSRIN